MIRKLRKWWEVADDAEKRFFSGIYGDKGLARHPDFEWRSTGKIAEESGLSKERVEEIAEKYFLKGMVLQHPKDHNKWGYWERVDPGLGTQNHLSIAESDQQKRITKADKP